MADLSIAMLVYQRITVIYLTFQQSHTIAQPASAGSLGELLLAGAGAGVAAPA